MQKDGIVIDKIILTKSTSYTPSGTGPAQNPQGVPAAPVLNTATAGTGQVSLSWTGVSGAAGYKIVRGTISGNYGTTGTDVGPATSKTVTGLSNGTTYYFAVYAYNVAGQSLNSNELSATPSAPETATLFIKNADYNAAGQMTKVEYGNGDITTYTYNSLNLRLTRLHTVDKNGVAVQDLNYTYDSAGNILSIADNINTADQTFKYDELNRLKEAVGQGYGTKAYVYDKVGNIVQKDGKTYSYGVGSGGPHAVTSTCAGGVCTNYAYDANGNMTSKVEAGVTTAYTYDAENRLTKVTKNGSTIAQYEYDGDGGRTKKTATLNGVTTTTTFVGSLFESDSKGRSTKYIFLGGQRIASITQSPTLTSNILYYHADHLGGANVLIDANGLKKELIEYEPFGQESRHEKYSSVSSEEIAWYYFTGKPKDDETGLLYFGARYYDPSIGRFITPDTIVPGFSNPQALNRYSYALNNPVNRIDPDGHKSFWKKIGNFFKQAAGAIISVAFTFVGMPFIGAIVSSAVSTAINGGSFADFGIGLGVGLAAGFAGGTLGGKIGGFFDMNKAGWGQAALRGGLGGAIGGAGSAAIYKQDIWKGALIGAGAGIGTASALWGMNNMRTNDFIKNNLKLDPSLNAQQRAELIQSTREAGQSPVGGRLMSRYIKSGSTLNLFSESVSPFGPGQGPHVQRGTDDMYFDGDTQARLGSSIAGEPWGPSLDDATVFVHESGHTATGFNLSDPLNVAYSENLYRAWVGSPARNDYGVLSSGGASQPVPNRSLWNRIIYQY